MRVLRSLLGAPRVPVWYDRRYRLPLPGLESAGVEPRRADFVVGSLQRIGVLGPGDLRAPQRISYAEVARAHDTAYLDKLMDAETLARIFAADPSEMSVDEVLTTIRLACGATLGAARESLSRRGPSLNLLGGFHHAAPDRGGGLCALNDIAIAVASLRADGFAGRVAVLDLDAHPPDGTAACFANDAAVWIGSLSGSHWGDLPRVEEIVLPDQAGDGAYLAELARLLARMPRPALAFVIAGGDVLAGDKMGRLGLSLDGARRRDLQVLAALRGIASVWLPGGGYHRDAWKVLAGTGMALAGRGRKPLRLQRDPLAASFSGIFGNIELRRLRGNDLDLTLEDLEADLQGAPRAPRLVGFYPAEGLEYALQRYGVLDFLGRLGYGLFRVTIEPAVSGGDRARLYGTCGASEHLLIEVVLERRNLAGFAILYVHWTSLRNPRAHFHASHPHLPGQDVPGLGLAREIGELYEKMARRLGLAGVAFRPSWYHTAYAARHRMQFLDPARQGRFEALLRDLHGTPLADATTAVADGRVLLNGAPYAWEPDEMVAFLDPPADDDRAPAVAAARDAAHFTLARTAAGATIPA